MEENKIIKFINENLKVNEFNFVVFSTLILVPFLCFISPIVSIVFVYFMCFLMIIKSDDISLLFFVLFCFIQNITLIVFANKFSATETTLFSLSKEMMAYTIICTNFFRKGKSWKYFTAPVIFLLLLGVSFLTSKSAIYSKVLTIRQLLLPFVCFFLGYFINCSKDKLKRIYRIIVYLSIITSIIGLFEIFLFKNSLWDKLPLLQYQINKGTDFDFYNNVPLNYYTWDFYDLTGNAVRRLVSHFGDPLITAHYLFLGFCLCDQCGFSIKKNSIIKVLLFVSIFLTLCKGAYISLLIYLCLYLLRRLNWGKIKKIIIILVPSSVVIFIVVYNFALKILPNSSIVVHLSGFLNGVFNSSLFGNGIGTAGVITGIVGGTEITASSESFIGILTFQLGYIGLFVFILFFSIVILDMLKKYYKNHHKDLFYLIVILLSVLMESLFSESSIGIVATGLYFAFSGIEISDNVVNEIMTLEGGISDEI